MFFRNDAPKLSQRLMNYATAILTVGLCSAAAGLASFIVHRRVNKAVRRHHHEVGGAIFLQLGVIYAVLLAFVFSETWGEYNIAAQAINTECADLHGSTILAHDLPNHAGDAFTRATVLYVTTVITKEWPTMARRRESSEAQTRLYAMIHAASDLQALRPRETEIRTEILSLLQDAHQQRETRLFQMNQGLPKIMWLLLLLYAAVLTGFIVLSGVEYATSMVIFSSLFCCLVLFILIIVKLLDYPFEGALALQPTDFRQTLIRIASLTGAP